MLELKTGSDVKLWNVYSSKDGDLVLTSFEETSGPMRGGPERFALSALQEKNTSSTFHLSADFTKVIQLTPKP